MLMIKWKKTCMPSLHYFYQNYSFDTCKTDGQKTCLWLFHLWIVEFLWGDNVFEPQSEVIEEDISKWGRDKQANTKLGMLHLREERTVSTLSFLSFHAEPHFHAGVLLCNAQRQFRIWMCVQCLHMTIHNNCNRCFVYMVIY